MPIINGKYRRPQLRNSRVNYRFGWFFVTFQVFQNKSELGAIVEDKCVLNTLGEAVKKIIETLKKDYDIKIDKSQIVEKDVIVNGFGKTSLKVDLFNKVYGFIHIQVDLKDKN